MEEDGYKVMMVRIVPVIRIIGQASDDFDITISKSHIASIYVPSSLRKAKV